MANHRQGRGVQFGNVDVELRQLAGIEELPEAFRVVGQFTRFFL